MCNPIGMRTAKYIYILTPPPHTGAGGVRGRVVADGSPLGGRNVCERIRCGGVADRGGGGGEGML